MTSETAALSDGSAGTAVAAAMATAVVLQKRCVRGAGCSVVRGAAGGCDEGHGRWGRCSRRSAKPGAAGGGTKQRGGRPCAQVAQRKKKQARGEEERKEKKKRKKKKEKRKRKRKERKRKKMKEKKRKMENKWEKMGKKI